MEVQFGERGQAASGCEPEQGITAFSAFASLPHQMGFVRAVLLLLPFASHPNNSPFMLTTILSSNFFYLF